MPRRARRVGHPAVRSVFAVCVADRRAIGFALSSEPRSAPAAGTELNSPRAVNATAREQTREHIASTVAFPDRCDQAAFPRTPMGPATGATMRTATGTRTYVDAGPERPNHRSPCDTSSGAAPHLARSSADAHVPSGSGQTLARDEQQAPERELDTFLLVGSNQEPGVSGANRVYRSTTISAPLLPEAQEITMKPVPPSSPVRRCCPSVSPL
jgi:hypothetical protein